MFEEVITIFVIMIAIIIIAIIMIIVFDSWYRLKNMMSQCS